jgi:hypothetical protein
MREEFNEEQEEATGEFHETYEMASASHSEDMSSILIVLTSIFLVVSIFVIAFHLYSVYDIGKDPKKIANKESAIRRNN